MADPVGFEGANHVYQAPDGRDDVRDLECFITQTETISCWRLSEDELKTINETGVVWLSVQTHPVPPVLISADALVFIGDRPAKAEPKIPKRKRSND